MLFDLRARGRRRTVQAVYLTLAVLMGGGLILFGIGSSTTGGLFDAFKGSGGRDQGGDQQAKEVQAARRQTQARPNDPAAWAALAKAHALAARQGDNYQRETGTFTGGGRAQLRQAVGAWERYLNLEPPKPDAGLAALMLPAYEQAGQVEGAVRAAEIFAEDQPSPNSWYKVALYAYAAGQERKGDLAGERAVELAPADRRPTVQAQVDAAKQQAEAAAKARKGTAGRGTPAGPAPGAPPLPPPASR